MEFRKYLLALLGMAVFASVSLSASEAFAGKKCQSRQGSSSFVEGCSQDS